MTTLRASSLPVEAPGAWFHLLADTIGSGVALLDGEGRAIWCNGTARSLLGLPASARPGAVLKRLGQVVPRSFFAARHAAEVVTEVEVEPTVERRLHLRLVPLDEPDELQRGVMLLLDDRTRSSELESSLVLAGRMEVGRLLRTQVHDLKAPLNTMALSLEVLRRELAEEGGAETQRDERTATIDTLQREVARLGRSLDFLVRHTVRKGRVERTPRSLEVRRLIRDVARLVRPRARESGVRIRTELPAASTYCLANGDLFKQALLNLVLNAIEAQPDGGRVRLRVDRHRDHVLVLVEDSGPGIDEELRERVFDMSFTTKATGNGIGLAVARSLVESMGGRLGLQGARGAGAAFQIRLPGAVKDRSA